MEIVAMVMALVGALVGATINRSKEEQHVRVRIPVETQRRIRR